MGERTMDSMRLARRALTRWDARRWAVASVFAALFAVLLGVPTVMIPNSLFGREIPVVWWNYPVWIATSLLSGVLAATYWRGPVGRRLATASGDAVGPEIEGGITRAVDVDAQGEGDVQGEGEDRPSRLGVAGGVLAWFAIGCPVCNKFALLALGYSGAVTWFAPVQPFLGIAGLALAGAAAVVRLRGEVACSLPMAVRTDA